MFIGKHIFIIFLSLLALLQRKAKRPREILPPIRTFRFDHFTVENQINTRNEWYSDSKAEDLQRLPYSKRALLKEAMFIVAIVFKVLQSGVGVAWRKKLRHKIINQACCLFCHKAFAVFRHVHSVQNNISKSALHRLVCIIATHF